MENKYTPATVNGRFSIPLYQRLFEWEKDQVEQLLSDLYSHYKKQSGQPYYIGVLTVYKDKESNVYSLVDGQQRFTVLTLMGIVLGWDSFLKENDIPRLSFFARKKDQEYLQALIDKENYSNPNQKMEDAITTITEYFENIEDKNEKEKLKDFVFRSTTFFLSELPTNYTIEHLNQYFEAMNEAGKGLENHEILKVRLLKELPDDKKENCTHIWNRVSEMDKSLFSQKTDETNLNYRNQVLKLMQSGSSEILNNLSKENQNPNESSMIKDIKPSSVKPNVENESKGEKSILSFSDFLLQVLWLTLDNKEVPVTEFFNKYKLLETFENYLIKKQDQETLKKFYDNLLRFKLIFDYYIIKINSSDNRSTNYSLNFYQEKEKTENNTEIRNQLIQYQSMLYVSTPSYYWIPFILSTINDKNDITYKEFLDIIKKWDDDRHKLDISKLNYGSIDRYWFWRLDYYLWEDRDNMFKDESRKVADNYLFKANRSIEHVVPQHAKSESIQKIDNEYRHSFGNLAMISSGQNSSLKNESFEVKKAHVEAYIKKSISGSIESLKLLKIYESKTWDNEKLLEHEKEMIEILEKSFEK